jgi:hypothetical protein
LTGDGPTDVVDVDPQAAATTARMAVSAAEAIPARAAWSPAE